MRDYTENTKEEDAKIPEMAEKLGILSFKSKTAAPQQLTTSVDLRDWCSPVENQMNLGSCTANAGVGVIEYFQRRAFGRYIEGSRLFVYKTTRNLMGVTGDTGAWLRDTMAALVLCGVPPERYHPYTDRKTPGPGGEPTFDEEPSNFVYSVVDNLKP